MRAQNQTSLLSEFQYLVDSSTGIIYKQAQNSFILESQQNLQQNIHYKRDSGNGIVANQNNMIIQDLIRPQQKQNIKLKSPMIDPDTVTPLTANQEMNVQDVPDINEKQSFAKVLKKNVPRISKNIKRKITRRQVRLELRAGSKATRSDRADHSSEQNYSEKSELIELLNTKMTQNLSQNSKKSNDQCPDQRKQFFSYPPYYIDNLKKYILNSSADKLMAQMYLNHFSQTCQILQHSAEISPPENFSVLLKIQPLQKQQKTLVIDLDETLIHCNESKLLLSDFQVTIKLIDGNNVNAEISVRPYAQQFLQNMSQYYEVMIYTASNEDYANQVIDFLDPQNQYVKYRIFREDYINNNHIKDLRILGRDLDQLILIDNSAQSFLYQIHNGIPIIPYLDNKNDDELQRLEKFLIELSKVNNVMLANQEIFKLEKIRKCNSKSQALKLFF